MLRCWLSGICPMQMPKAWHLLSSLFPISRSSFTERIGLQRALPETERGSSMIRASEVFERGHE